MVKKQRKFILGGLVIVGTLFWLGWVGVSESKTYYHTVAELKSMNGSALRHRMRVGGDIRHGSIQRLPGRVDFVIEQEGHALNVSYVGRDPLPDTFTDRAQAVVEGRQMPDGRFAAEKVQAKCASKYEAAPDGTRPGYDKPGSVVPERKTAPPSSAPSKS